jgi:hypothetical protein
MKAIMLKDIVDETRDYKKGEIIDVFLDPCKDETAVYHLYKLEDKTYRHWFNILCNADVKIIDSEGYDLESAIQIILDENSKYINKIIEKLHVAFNNSEKQ